MMPVYRRHCERLRHTVLTTETESVACDVTTLSRARSLFPRRFQQYFRTKLLPLFLLLLLAQPRRRLMGLTMLRARMCDRQVRGLEVMVPKTFKEQKCQPTGLKEPRSGERLVRRRNVGCGGGGCDKNDAGIRGCVSVNNCRNQSIIGWLGNSKQRSKQNRKESPFYVLLSILFVDVTRYLRSIPR